jgi:hypothetical protein
MGKFLAGFVLGVVVATIGFAGVAHYLDQGVQAIKNTTEQVMK